MLVIPSIDIMREKCVQLVGGKRGTMKDYGDPVKQTKRWVSEGARYLHLVDLDAAMDEGSNPKKIVEVLAAAKVPVQVGGGIRTVERAKELLENGAERVIVGTAAVKDPDFLKNLIASAGRSKVIVALDSRGGRVAVGGWKESTEKTPLELAKLFERMGVGGILFTTVDVEGGMRGVAYREIQELVEAVKTPIIASGGVGSLEDVGLARDAGAAALVLGMALYQKKFSLQRAMEVAEG